jgi:hypothetical protein
MRLLHGARPHVQALGRVEAPREIERLPAPALLHERDALLDALPAVAPVRLKRLIVLERAAAPDTYVEASAADDVQHRELLGQVHRMMERQQADAHAQSERRGVGRHVRCQDRRRRAEAIVVEVVLGNPDGVIAPRLGGQHLAQA